MQAVLIRHLPTKWNITGRLQGKRDIPISYLSIFSLQSGILVNKEHLKKLEPFDCVLTSSLQRTQQTAAVYGYENHQIEPFLDELDFGMYEGTFKKEMIQALGDDWWNASKHGIIGKSIETLEQNVFAFLDRYKNFDRILAFGHGSWLRALLSIEKCGSIDKMNRLNVNNNELITISLPNDSTILEKQS